VSEIQLIDIAVNLSHGPLQDRVTTLVQDAANANVTKLIALGCSEDGSDVALAHAKAFPGTIFSTAGIHPHDAKTFNEQSLAHLTQLALQPEVVALGECGLDFNRNFSPRSQQIDAFEAQLQLAVQLNMPVVMHQRDAHEKFIEILEKYRPQLINAVIHCFTGTKEELDQYLELDLHVGVTGWICDERRGQSLQQAVKYIPSNRLMLETDSPYLLPRDLKPKPKSRTNTPVNLKHIAQKVADLRQEPLEQLLNNCLNTTKKFFNLAT